MGTAVTASAPHSLSTQLERFTPRLVQAASTGGDADRYVKRQLVLAGVQAQKNPDLQKCDPASVAAALVRVCAAGLEVGQTAHLVPFGRECTFIADWKGLVQLMIASGHARDVYARAVHAKDVFRVRQGMDESLEHEPYYGQDGRGPVVAFYAVAKLAGGRFTFEVMSDEEVEAIRKNARSGNSPAWKNNRAEMGKKTVIRRLAKRMPQTAALEAALADADEPGAAPEAGEVFVRVGPEPRATPPMRTGDLYAHDGPNYTEADVSDMVEVDEGEGA